MKNNSTTFAFLLFLVACTMGMFCIVFLSSPFDLLGLLAAGVVCGLLSPKVGKFPAHQLLLMLLSGMVLYFTVFLIEPHFFRPIFPLTAPLLVITGFLSVLLLRSPTVQKGGIFFTFIMGTVVAFSSANFGEGGSAGWRLAAVIALYLLWGFVMGKSESGALRLVFFFMLPHILLLGLSLLIEAPNATLFFFVVCPLSGLVSFLAGVIGMRGMGKRQLA